MQYICKSYFHIKLHIFRFDHVKTEEYYTDVDEMYKLMRTHKHIYKDMQRQHEVISNNIHL